MNPNRASPTSTAVTSTIRPLLGEASELLPMAEPVATPIEAPAAMPIGRLPKPIPRATPTPMPIARPAPMPVPLRLPAPSSMVLASTIRDPGTGVGRSSPGERCLSMNLPLRFYNATSRWSTCRRPRWKLIALTHGMGDNGLHRGGKRGRRLRLGAGCDDFARRSARRASRRLDYTVNFAGGTWPSADRRAGHLGG